MVSPTLDCSRDLSSRLGDNTRQRESIGMPYRKGRGKQIMLPAPDKSSACGCSMSMFEIGHSLWLQKLLQTWLQCCLVARLVVSGECFTDSEPPWMHRASMQMTLLSFLNTDRSQASRGGPCILFPGQNKLQLGEISYEVHLADI